MSLVGTRPPTVDEWEKYELHHRSRMSTKPGIDLMFFYKFQVDLRHRILILPHNNGVGILPEKKIISCQMTGQDIFLEGKIVVRIKRSGFHVDNRRSIHISPLSVSNIALTG